MGQRRQKLEMNYKNLSGVARLPLSEQVYRTLVDSIADGILIPGTELKEQHLAKQMNVSATPVREAIRRLASDGLVEIIPYRGAVVRALNQQEISEAYACREALERLAVAECIAHLEERDIQNLYELIECYQDADNSSDISALSQQFDTYLYSLSNNQTLCGLLDMLNGIISRDRKYSSSNIERRQAIYKEHKAIIQAMEARDVSAAQDAISAHIRNGRKFIEQKG